MSNDDLKQLAQDIFDGLVFTNRHLPEGDEWLLSTVFNGMTDDSSLVYAYNKDVLSYGDDELPMFDKFYYLSEEQDRILCEYYIQIPGAEL